MGSEWVKNGSWVLKRDASAVKGMTGVAGVAASLNRPIQLYIYIHMYVYVINEPPPPIKKKTPRCMSYTKPATFGSPSWVIEDPK